MIQGIKAASLCDKERKWINNYKREEKRNVIKERREREREINKKRREERNNVARERRSRAI